jgi:hypothetical protein
MMIYTYKFLPKPSGGEQYILRKEDNAIIPPDTANVDYEAYLEWAKSNTTEAAD